MRWSGWLVVGRLETTTWARAIHMKSDMVDNATLSRPRLEWAMTEQ
jgi:hypothetical protein